MAKSFGKSQLRSNIVHRKGMSINRIMVGGKRRLNFTRWGQWHRDRSYLFKTEICSRCFHYVLENGGLPSRTYKPRYKPIGERFTHGADTSHSLVSISAIDDHTGLTSATNRCPHDVQQDITRFQNRFRFYFVEPLIDIDPLTEEQTPPANILTPNEQNALGLIFKPLPTR